MKKRKDSIGEKPDLATMLHSFEAVEEHYLNAIDIEEPELPEKKKEEFKLWHKRLGHLGATEHEKIAQGHYSGQANSNCFRRAMPM